jgi:aspartate/methionine/tyrosine aminotransferase
VANYYQDQYGVTVSMERVIITPGTSGAFLLAFGVWLNPGDRFAIADPGYPCYPNMIRHAGGKPERIPVTASAHYQFTWADLKPFMDQGGRGALVTSPSNPTGTLIPDTAFKAVTHGITAADGLLISDEIYHGITYGERARSALEFTDQCIVINGFSKFFAMTGWRLGWIIVPEEAIRPVEMLAQNLFISASTIAQHAALAAFDALPELRAQVQQYDINRRFLLDAARSLGFEIAVNPRGAFYVYADVQTLLERTGEPNAQSLCQTLLEQTGVAITPGIDFGRHLADRHVRFSYATTLDRIEEGMARLKAFLR